MSEEMYKADIEVRLVGTNIITKINLNRYWIIINKFKYLN